MSITSSALTDFRPSDPKKADELSAFASRPRRSMKVVVRHVDDTPRWLPYVFGRLTELDRLLDVPEDEVPTPLPEALERALPELARVMQIDAPTPSVVPTVEGGVQFVWHKGGWDVEMEIGPKETLVWARRRDGDIAWSGILDDYVGSLRVLLAELASQD